jgi:hypothetical protein
VSQYLRDENFKNLTITEDRLRKINDDFIEVRDKSNVAIHEKFSTNQKLQDEKNLLITYIVRFDGKGFRLFEFAKMLKYFQDAHRVERIVFTLDSLESMRSNRMSGHCAELGADIFDNNHCLLRVQADDQDWMDITFGKLKERMVKCKNNSHLVRNRMTDFIIQLSGLFAGIVLSFWTSIRFQHKLNIDSSFAFIFIITLLVFSHFWTLIQEAIYRVINFYWPYISFKEKNGFHWLIQNLIGAVFVGIVIAVVTKLLSYLADAIKAVLV